MATKTYKKIVIVLLMFISILCFLHGVLSVVVCHGLRSRAVIVSGREHKSTMFVTYSCI